LFSGEQRAFTELHEVPTVKSKGNSALETFELFKQHADIQKIAEMRGLAVSTIEGHLLEFIRLGKLSVEQLVKPEKIKAISAIIATMEGAKSSEVKAALGENYSYNEIKAVFYHRSQS
jgi:uncharacterized protein YpbB